MKIKIIILIVLILILTINVKNIGRYFFPLNYRNYISKYSSEYNLDPYLVTAIIKTESNFNKSAKSSKSALGLMQITIQTGYWAAQEMNLTDFNADMLYDSEFNIKMGCWYLSDLKKEFNGNMDLVLAAYNGGRGNVKKWLQDIDHSKDGQNLYHIPFKETDKYVKKVNTNCNIYKFLYKIF